MCEQLIKCKSPTQYTEKTSVDQFSETISSPIIRKKTMRSPKFKKSKKLAN